MWFGHVYVFGSGVLLNSGVGVYKTLSAFSWLSFLSQELLPPMLNLQLGRHETVVEATVTCNLGISADFCAKDQTVMYSLNLLS